MNKASDITAMRVAYNVLAELAPHELRAALAWVKLRLDQDELARSAEALTGGVEPKYWAVSPTTEFCDSADEAVTEYGDDGEVVVLDGWAVVERRYAVLVPIGDDEGFIEGHEIMYFDTRELALWIESC
jgi:hypothetical protein